MILTETESRELLRAHGLRIPEVVAAVGDKKTRLVAALDRDRRCHVLQATNASGLLLSQPIDPFIGLSPFVARRLAGHLGLPETARAAIERLVEGLYALLQRDGVRIELDRLSPGDSGEIAVGCVHVELDRTAAFRHPEWKPYGERLPGTAIEQAFRRVGAVAAEIDPDGTIVAVVSGAGIMMTVLDMLTAMKASVRCIVDMQGLPLQGERGMRPIVENAAKMNPHVTFIGGRFQAPVAHLFAETVTSVHRSTPIVGQVVTWIAGNMAAEAQALFRAEGFTTHDDMRAAMAAVAAARR